MLFGRPLVLFRVAGTAYALNDRCAHRNAPLSAGAVRGGCLECPYHGWRYAPSGKVQEIPALGEVESDRYAVKGFPTHESDGLVWVWPGSAPPVGTPPRSITVDSAKRSHSFIMETTFQGTVEGCLENFLDCPHATTVHKGFFRSPTRRKVKVALRTLHDGAEVEYFDEPREKSLVWKMLDRSKSSMKHTDRFVAPATSRVDYAYSDGSQYTITSHCTPAEEGTVKVFTTIAFSVPRFGIVIRAIFPMLAKLIIKQDIRMVEKQVENIRSWGKSVFAVTRADLLYPLICQWRNALSSGTKPPEAGSCEEREITL